MTEKETTTSADTSRPDASCTDETSPDASHPTHRARRIAIVLMLIVLLLGCALALMHCAPKDTSGFFDADAKTGQAPYKTEDEIQAELNRIIEEGMFNISIASTIEFADGASLGKAYIENVPANRYAMKVKLALDDGREVVYESGGIAPGSYIEDIALARDLEPGEYAATATFTAFDMDTHDEVGVAAARVTLLVRG